MLIPVLVIFSWLVGSVALNSQHQKIKEQKVHKEFEEVLEQSYREYPVTSKQAE